MEDSPIKELLKKGIQKSLEEQQVPLHLHLKVVEELSKALTRHKADINLHHVLMNRHALQLKEHDAMSTKEREAHQAQLAQYDAEVKRLSEKDWTGAPGKDAEVDVEGLISEILSRIPTPKDGKTPVKGVDYFDGEKGKDAEEAKVIEHIITKIQKEKVIDISHLRNAESFIFNTGQKAMKIKFEEMLHGGGGSTGGGGFTVWTTTNTPDGTRTTFAVPSATAQPSFLVIDGVMKPPTSKAGTVLWTWNAGVATVTVPPNDDLYAIK
jgi:hypothetical protein